MSITDEQLDEWHKEYRSYISGSESEIINTLIQALRAERKWSAECEEVLTEIRDSIRNNADELAATALAKKKEIL